MSMDRERLLKMYGLPGLGKTLEVEIDKLEALLGELVADRNQLKVIRTRLWADAESHARYCLTAADKPAYDNLRMDVYKDALAAVVNYRKEQFLDEERRKRG